MICALQASILTTRSLTELLRTSSTQAGAHSVSVTDIAALIAAVTTMKPKRAHASAQLCELLSNVVWWRASAGCAAVHQVGGVALLFDCLKEWPGDKTVVSAACLALHRLAYFGTPDVHTTMKCVPDCEALLTAAYHSKYERAGHTSWAAETLTKLGYKKPTRLRKRVCVIM